jgi:hypothetical protein
MKVTTQARIPHVKCNVHNIFITSKILTIMIFTINRIKETYQNP